MATIKKTVAAPAATGGRKDSMDAPKLTMESLQEMLKEQTKSILQNMDERFKHMDDRFQHMDDRFQQLEDKVDFKIETLEQRMEVKLANYMGEMTGKYEEVKGKVQEIETAKTALVKDVDEIQTVQNKQDAQIIMMQFRLMENALRFRGYPEARNQDLKEIFSQALAEMVGVSQDDMRKEIDRIYRANSRVASQRGLPRDIVIYFVTKTMRYRILEASYKEKLLVQQKEVTVLKEIPPKMLRSRRDFLFLTRELRLRKVDYKWEAPFGLTVWMQGRRYFLDTILKAQKFYHEVLKVPVEEVVEILEKKQQQDPPKEKFQIQEVLASWMQQTPETPAVPIEQRVAEQRVTRAKTREQEAMGGAKSKEDAAFVLAPEPPGPEYGQ